MDGTNTAGKKKGIIAAISSARAYRNDQKAIENLLARIPTNLANELREAIHLDWNKDEGISGMTYDAETRCAYVVSIASMITCLTFHDVTENQANEVWANIKGLQGREIDTDLLMKIYHGATGKKVEKIKAWH